MSKHEEIGYMKLMFGLTQAYNTSAIEPMIFDIPDTTVDLVREYLLERCNADDLIVCADDTPYPGDVEIRVTDEHERGLSLMWNWNGTFRINLREYFRLQEYENDARRVKEYVRSMGTHAGGGV